MNIICTQHLRHKQKSKKSGEIIKQERENSRDLL